MNLELTDPGFDHSLLCEFRARLVDGAAEHVLLEKMLVRFRERKWLKVRARQRTDSTHVLGALRMLSRLELTAETMRATLNTLAAVAPGWVREHADPEWFERYSRRIEDYRLPKGEEARKEYLKSVGADGVELLAKIDAPHASQSLKRLAEVEVLHKIGEQQYEMLDGELRVRNPKKMPGAAHCIESPYEPEVRYATKRSMSWVGYKVHVTESCEEDLPNLITGVRPTGATATECKAAFSHPGWTH